MLTRRALVLGGMALLAACQSADDRPPPDPKDEALRRQRQQERLDRLQRESEFDRVRNQGLGP